MKNQLFLTTLAILFLSFTQLQSIQVRNVGQVPAKFGIYADDRLIGNVDNFAPNQLSEFDVDPDELQEDLVIRWEPLAGKVANIPFQTATLKRGALTNSDLLEIDTIKVMIYKGRNREKWGRYRLLRAR